MGPAILRATRIYRRRSVMVTDPTVKPTNITGGTMAFLALLAAPASFVLCSYVVVVVYFFFLLYC